MPLSSTLIRNVHNSVLVISICCLRPNYTVCSGLSKAAHLLCEKQFRNLRLPSAGVLLLWSGKIRVTAGSAQHEFCLRSGCRVSAAEQDGLLLCKRGWSASRPTVQPRDSHNPQLRPMSKSCQSRIPSVFLSFPLFFQLNFLLALKHFLLVVTPANLFFKNSWYSHNPGKKYFVHRS